MPDTCPDVLVIEDNKVDIDLTLQAFTKCTPTPHTLVLSEGTQALDFLHRTGSFANRSPEDPKLIVLDLKLPLVDGTYILRQIASDPTAKLIPLVIVTSSREPRDIYSTYKLGANSYVVKPVNSDEYIEIMRKIAGYWLSVNQAPVT